MFSFYLVTKLVRENMSSSAGNIAEVLSISRVALKVVHTV